MKTLSSLKALCVPGIFALALSACAQAPQTISGPPSLELSWSTPSFENPESVLLSADKSFLYVSNVNGEGAEHDANGYISKLALDGTILDAKWVEGLDAPKGLALQDGKLYVSDINRLVEIDAQTGEILKSVPAEGAAFLNDVAAVTNLGILISDSGTQSLYLYDGDTMSIWLQDEKLRGINGLHVDGNNLLVATMSAGELLSLNIKSKTIEVIAGGMENADGIKTLEDGSYFLSSWPGQLYHISKSGETTLLQDTREQKIFMNDFELAGNTVYMPSWEPGTVRAIELKY